MFLWLKRKVSRWLIRLLIDSRGHQAGVALCYTLQFQTIELKSRRLRRVFDPSCSIFNSGVLLFNNLTETFLMLKNLLFHWFYYVINLYDFFMFVYFRFIRRFRRGSFFFYRFLFFWNTCRPFTVALSNRFVISLIFL